MSAQNHVEAMDWTHQQQSPDDTTTSRTTTTTAVATRVAVASPASATATERPETLANNHQEQSSSSCSRLSSPSPSTVTTASSNLKNETVFKLIDHAVGAIALECGYHVAHQTCLDILNDVCCDYFKKISALLRLSRDTEEWRDSDSDFVDSLERVFHQVNIPSTANLHQFICKMDAFKRHQLQQQQQQQQQPQNNAQL